ncbi:DNA-binding response regulator [Burkholderia sp. WAC0059]|uniref:response regulator transcription factor n=1 Tax=Burkholderia sp. WAC0059 TaxID=2066022 RepID=UPI000C7F0B25|nr:response regulator transcription factor [Burkholderia sp. WAC0059]PLZ03829.1 DNA-binding response regulator [Burkholderia sp. WAC0059]
MRIAVLDDEPDQLEFVCEALTIAGHACHAFSRGEDLLKRLRRETFDLLVLDWLVPDVGGDEVLRWVRLNQRASLPVIFMTNRGRDIDVALMLNSGADDYVVKPVSALVLTARVGALLRRAYGSQQPELTKTFGVYAFDLAARQASVDGCPVYLTHKEFDLALMLFQRLGQPLSRAHIFEAIWRQAEDIPSRTMDTHISVLRSKLNLRPENGFRLTPIYGYGYRLERVDAASAVETEAASGR